MASAGNPGNDKPVGFPGAYEDWVITVGAVDKNDKPAYFTARGKEVDVTNYGVSVYTHDNKQGYWAVSGTSFSSPLTAGVIALVLTHHKAYFSQFKGKALRDAVEEYLEKVSADVYEKGYDDLTGWGVPRLKALIESNPEDLIGKPTPIQPPRLIAPLNGSTIQGLTATFRWEPVAGNDNYEFLVAKDQNFTQVVNGYRGPNTSYSVKFAEQGTYYWKVRSTNKELGPWSSVWGLQVKEAAVAAPILIKPKEGEQIEVASLEWEPISNASYLLQIARDINFTDKIKEVTLDTNSYSEVLNPGTYYWRVKAKVDQYEGPYSMARSFTIKKSEFPVRTFSIKLDEVYTIWYEKMKSQAVEQMTTGIRPDADVLEIKELIVNVTSDQGFDDVYATTSAAVKKFFKNRGLILKIGDAKDAHNATITFLHLLIKKEIPTFEVIKMTSESKGRKQV